VRATFEEASAVLGYDLWALVSTGPAAALDATERTQPAMLAAGVATWRAWRERGGAAPAVVCGHSLGEFAALVCSGALEFAPAVVLVRLRGELMQQAVPAGSGAMAAIIGLDDAAVAAACEQAAAAGVVEPTNFNAPGQVVIAGESAAVQCAIEAAKAAGARRAVALPVSVPSHTRLMRGAAERLRERLLTIPFRAPDIRYVSAVDATAHREAADIQALLARQLSSPVRWTQTLRAVAAGQAQVIECGPGRVLTGLNRRIERRPDLEFLALEDPASIDAALVATQSSHPSSQS
jgi:[acyl-carrier-protein] S-malonyltransferase